MCMSNIMKKLIIHSIIQSISQLSTLSFNHSFNRLCIIHKFHLHQGLHDHTLLPSTDPGFVHIRPHCFLSPYSQYNHHVAYFRHCPLYLSIVYLIIAKTNSFGVKTYATFSYFFSQTKWLLLNCLLKCR